MGDDVRLSTAIMAHPSRRDRAEALAARHPELAARVVLDPRPQDGPSALRTAAAAWSAAPEDATHHLVLQDDAVPCADFLPKVLAGVRALPEASLSLFAEWTSMTAHNLRLAAMAGAVWAEAVDEYVPCVALVLPAALGREFGEAARSRLHTWPAQDDVSLSHFLYERGVTRLCRIPTLVEHDGPASLTGNDVQGPRHSVCFADDVPDGPDGETVLMSGGLPFFSHFLLTEAPSRPFYAVRRPYSAHGGIPWDISPAEQWIQTRGLSPAQVDAMARVHVAEWRRRWSDVGGEVLDRLWLTPFTAGITLLGPNAWKFTPDGRALPDPFPLRDPFDLEALLAAPIVRRAFATLPQAALHPYADRAELERLREPLTELMLDAVRVGHRHAREAAPA
ncbi:hypothetical protein AB0I72_01635 [Nocardiopsis sp. NPDC049922]|uniref:hypothetical protein n=1 Tax=Nocardiopsis sp. NPDC049922 TaxID=3155157 RepID=UPI00340A5F39